MRKLAIKAASHASILILTAGAWALTLPDAYAAVSKKSVPATKDAAAKAETKSDTPKANASDEEESFDDIPMGDIENDADEAPPPPEFPYPGASEEGFKKTAKSPAYTQPAMKPLPVERPVHVDDDGIYHYDTTKNAPATFSNRKGVAAPLKTTPEGEYLYDTRTTEPTFSNRKGVEHPDSISAQGEYLYPVEASPRHGAGSFRFGLFSAPSIRNSDTGLAFKDVYGNGGIPTMLGDYEWQLTSKVGRLALKFGSGGMFATGHGVFKHKTPGRRDDDIPLEQFTFITFPNEITVVYKFQYADAQLFVPFVEGGGGYYTFAEFRDDGKSPKLGGALVTVAAVGGQILLDGLDRRSMRALDNDYGVNHIWATVQYRYVLGVNKNFDFTSQVINGGFLMEF